MLEHLWQYAVAAVAAIVWFIRLEGRVERTQQDIVRMEARIEKDRHSDQQTAQASRGEVMAMLQEVRGDIKALMRKVGGE